MTFYDKQQNPIVVENILSRSRIFLLAELPDCPGQDIVGLFIEDDEKYFLKCSFSRYWLPDLIKVAGSAEPFFRKY